MHSAIRLALPVLTTLLLPGAALAQNAGPNPDTAAVPAGSYKMDPRHASVTGTILRAGLSHFAFRFDKLDGSFDYDPKNPEASKVTVTIDAASLDSNVPAIDTMVKSGFFEPDKYPTITFTSTSIKRNGNKGTMTGDLTFVGTTHPVTLDVVYNGATVGKRTTMGFSATTLLKLADFGPMGTGFVTTHMLGQEVPLDIEVLFDKAQ
jgi:polyisoprenoid-binding protein YceI